MSLITDLRFALRSLARVKGLAITVVVTLALGIGANAAIFSVVRGVLLRPLVNRDEDRLIYIRQSAPGIGAENANFSVPEIQDLQRARQDADAPSATSRPSSSRWSASASRAWSAPASSAARTSRSWASVRCWAACSTPTDDGPQGRRRGGADASLLDHRAQERSVGDRQDDPARRSPGDHRRRARAVGALSAGNRDHRQRRDQPAPSRRDDGGRPRAPDDGAVRPARARRRPRSGARRAARRPRRDRQGASRGVSDAGRLPHRRRAAARSDHLAGADRPAGAARGLGAGLRHRLLERRQPDPGALGAARRRAGDPRGARRQHRRAAPNAARREPAALRRRRDPRRR